MGLGGDVLSGCFCCVERCAWYDSLSLAEWHEIGGQVWSDKLLWTGDTWLFAEPVDEESEGNGTLDDKVEDAFE